MIDLTRPPRRLTKQTLLLFLVIGWGLVTLALASWWLIHGLQQIQLVAGLDSGVLERLSSQRRMILWEGLTFITLLVMGIVGFLILLMRERRRNSQIEAFFATFTHELKTPLASLRLQAESLQEEFEAVSGPEKGFSRLVDRLLYDASRLELQLENSLFLATVRNSNQIHLEPLSVRTVIERLRPQFQDLRIELEGNAQISGDRRAFDSILKNLLQNARVHGGASEVKIRVEHSSQSVILHLEDNGRGFQGEIRSLGELFFRPNGQSGSGVGLHLCELLTERMRGKFRIQAGHPRFGVQMVLMRADGGHG